jgi:hypothetical protein
VSDHQIPWGLPGPTDPAERASASRVGITDDSVELQRGHEWPTVGIPDELVNPPELSDDAHHG